MLELKTNKPILALGDINPDIVLPYGDTITYQAKVSAGEKVEGGSKKPEIHPGGSIGNFASGLARLGMQSWFAGKAGDDYYAKFLRDDLNNDGCDTRYFLMDPNISTVMVIAVVDENKERVLYAVPSDNCSHLQLHKEDLPDSMLDEIGWVHSSGIMIKSNPAANTVADFLERAKAHGGVITSFDLNLRLENSNHLSPFVKDIADRCVEASNVVLGSGVEELMPLTGMPDPVSASQSLVREDRIVVCRDGKYGSTVYTTQGSFKCYAFDVPVVDKIGAGDSFNSGFIAACAQGLGLETANIWGNATACYNIARPGARNVPTPTQLEAFLKEYDGVFVKD